ncbi:unnamed protein product [Angiostrongylus costaricensis]|uniref:Endo/exonuclease/phosphatase domain-containing protein n=1 Tax=Angiostrongylus costaricensis TaxID=334426 RepID=A0A0R3PNA8_ANGCS|nr:unnamed protein product [Angiostrongylus costaricensis]
MVTICTYNARTLASESSIEDLLMQPRRTRYDVIDLAETRARQPLNAVYDTGEELFIGKCDSRGVGGVVVFVNKSLSMNIEFTIKKTWINPGFDNLRCLRPDIKL